jgi:hypothetical protein
MQIPDRTPDPECRSPTPLRGQLSARSLHKRTSRSSLEMQSTSAKPASGMAAGFRASAARGPLGRASPAPSVAPWFQRLWNDCVETPVEGTALARFTKAGKPGSRRVRRTQLVAFWPRNHRWGEVVNTAGEFETPRAPGAANSPDPPLRPRKPIERSLSNGHRDAARLRSPFIGPLRVARDPFFDVALREPVMLAMWRFLGHGLPLFDPVSVSRSSSCPWSGDDGSVSVQLWELCQTVPYGRVITSRL